MLTVRAAEVEDASVIARIHVETWRSAYRGIIPQGYLQTLDIRSRAVDWARAITHGRSTVSLVSEDHDRRIVGFVTGGRLRHRDDRFQAEIASLYVLGSHQRAGHGRRLFLAAANRLARQGLNGLFVWVLADNPARGFYAAMGGEEVAEVTRNFAGKPLKEIGYGWLETPSY
jgi:ribosomal protein S18 acetylase RimI-like enzyme